MNISKLYSIDIKIGRRRASLISSNALGICTNSSSFSYSASDHYYEINNSNHRIFQALSGSTFDIKDIDPDDNIDNNNQNNRYIYEEVTDLDIKLYPKSDQVPVERVVNERD